MKRIEYKAVFQNQNGSHEQVIAIFARDINSGFRKATDAALRDLSSGWEIVSVTFWQVTS